MKTSSNKRSLPSIVVSACALASFLFFPIAEARTLLQQYPRLANYYLSPTISDEQAQQLAQWDMVILGIELQYTNPGLFATLRSRNPDIIILAYVPSEEIPVAHEQLTDPMHPHYQLLHGVADEWWLKDSAGSTTGYWPGTHMLNVTNDAPLANGERWNTYLPNFVHTTVMSTGLWDGIFYDNVWPNIAWLNNGNIDSNLDGVADNAATLDQAWRDGMATLLATSRTLEGKNALIVGNGGGDYFSITNGRLIENFPSSDDGGWGGAMQKYIDALKRSQSPSVVIVNGKSTTGEQNDLAAMRYDLTSTLLGDGYFSFDYGSLRHSDLWWYDEYSAYVGKPLAAAKNLTHPKALAGTDGVWFRDFQDGIVLVNATGKLQKLDLQDGYEQIGAKTHTTDPNQIVNTVTLPAHDGLILLKRHQSVERGSFVNGALAKTFSSNGSATRQGFFTYNGRFTGGSTIQNEDVNNDGVIDTAVLDGARVFVLNGASGSRSTWYPFGKRSKNLSLATADLYGDGMKEILVGAGTGSLPWIRVYSEHGKLIRQFLAYKKTFRGGVNVSAGDVDGDGKAEIVTGTGAGGGPQVSVFDGVGVLRNRFFAYATKFHGGVRVAAGDVDGDGKAEIVTAPGPGMPARIRILDGTGRAVQKTFYAFAQNFTSGVVVDVADINFDHTNEIIVSAPTIF